MPPIDGPLTTPPGSVGWAARAAAAHVNSAATNGLFFMGSKYTWYDLPHTHESDHPRQAVPDDGAGVLHLGRLVSVDFRLLAEPRLHPGATELDSQRLPACRHRRHVLQQSVRRSQFRRRAVPRGQPSDRRNGDDLARLDAGVLAVLRLHAG